jgi:hypothetical protein
MLCAFLVDFIIRVFINPKFSPTLIMGRLIVGNQTPEYVWAQQKKFAWIIGVILSATMFIFMVVINSYSPITGVICFVCLMFLFFESAFGICLGCKFYSVFHKENARYCPGEICDVRSKQDIQKISGIQLFIVFAFFSYVFLMAWLFNDNFSKKPYDLFGVSTSSQTKPYLFARLSRQAYKLFVYRHLLFIDTDFHHFPNYIILSVNMLQSF